MAALLGAQTRELFAHRVRTAPHLGDLDTSGALLAQRQLALDPGFVEQAQGTVRGWRRGRMSETMGNQQTPMPVVMGVGPGVARHQVHARVDVSRLVGYAQIELEVGPVVWQRVHDALESVSKSHTGKPSDPRGHPTTPKPRGPTCPTPVNTAKGGLSSKPWR